MRTTFLSGLAAGAMMLASVGCDEAQYDAAVDNYDQELTESREALQSTTADGMLTEDEAEDVREQNEEVREALGEVAEQQGDLIESRTD